MSSGAVTSAHARATRYAAFAAVLAVAGTGATDCAGPAGHGAPGHHREHRFAKRVFGNGRAEQRCLLALWQRESGWSAYAVEDQRIGGRAPTYAYGIPQANPAVWGHPFELGDWRRQIRWGHRYIARRYGDACTAWSHENAHGWY